MTQTKRPPAKPGRFKASQQYSQLKDIHALPDSSALWSARYVTPILQKLWDVIDVQGFYTKCIQELCDERPHETIRVVSIGCGDAAIEVETCARLVGAGRRNVFFAGADVAHGAIDRAREFARARGLESYFDLQVARYDVLLEQPLHVVIANQVLHHIVDLEGTFDKIVEAIGQHGIFLSCDMIGRNGHMLWPEALAIMDCIWQRLPDRQKYNHMLNQYEARYSNWDNSREANEGIRAEDILPTLIDRFDFERFFAAGNLAVALLGRHYGANFDPNQEDDRAFIDQVMETDFNLIDLGYLKPVLMYASMSKRSRPSSYYRHWTPEFCVRRADPAAEYYLQHRYSVGESIAIESRSPTIACLGAGWSSPEIGGVWSNEALSTVEIPLSGTVELSKTRLQIVGMLFVAEGHEPNNVDVKINGVQITDFGAPWPENATHSVEIDLIELGDAPRLIVEFAYRQTFCPAELGVSLDTRNLAFRLVSLTLLPKLVVDIASPKS